MSASSSPSHHVTFTGSTGAPLAGRLDLPPAPAKAFALFAHCFTCSKDLRAAGVIAKELNKADIGVLRFDFTGLGHSGGEFANTDFSSNVEDLSAAAEWLGQHYQAPKILIGHSLGGAAVLVAALNLPDVRAVATINAPSSAAHVTSLFDDQDLEKVLSQGDAEVTIGGRRFRIRQDFLADLASQSIVAAAGSLSRNDKALLVMHAPTDQTVGIDHARILYEAARHPKSFIALDGADHLLRRASDAQFVASIIAAWSNRYTNDGSDQRFTYPAPAPTAQVVVAEAGDGIFLNQVTAGQHHLLADEPLSVGGFDAGMAPYDFLAAALGACTSMTLRLYGQRKELALDQVMVEVDHAKVRDDAGALVDQFSRRITLVGDLDDEERASLIRIADRCPVHRTLEGRARIVTETT